MTHIDARDPVTRERVVRFGATVRVLRLRAGLTQEQLAEKAGCDRQSVNRMEGATYSTSLPRIFRVADALGVPAAVLFADAGWEPEFDPDWRPTSSDGRCSASRCEGDPVAEQASTRTAGWRGGQVYRRHCAEHLAAYGRRVVAGRLQVIVVVPAATAGVGAS